MRYVERNALRSGLVARAEDWQWSSLWRREFGSVESRRLLAGWPIAKPRDWTDRVNGPQTEAELDAVRPRCGETVRLEARNGNKRRPSASA